MTSATIVKSDSGSKGPVATERHRRLSPVKFYIVCVMTSLLALAQLVLSHTTHCLLLRFDAYHGIYNILSLTACFVSMKLCARGSSLANTFGWARAEVLGAAVTLVFFSALGFSVLIEALQTLMHIAHGEEESDAFHYEEAVMVAGAVSLLATAVCFLLIGGYTFHQGSFLVMTPQGAVMVQQPTDNVPHRRQQGFRETLRDITGGVLVMVSAGVNMVSKEVSMYFDPCAAIVAVLLIGYSSFPYLLESSSILLQTLPASLDLKVFQKQLRARFPTLLDVHEVHVWQLAPRCIVATAHLVFPDTEVFLEIQEELSKFFAEWGITQATLQPEFIQVGSEDLCKASPLGCILSCNQEECQSRHCCTNNSNGKSHHHNRRHHCHKNEKHDAQEEVHLNINAA